MLCWLLVPGAVAAVSSCPGCVAAHGRSMLHVLPSLTMVHCRSMACRGL
jgi:hypothetical protein